MKAAILMSGMYLQRIPGFVLRISFEPSSPGKGGSPEQCNYHYLQLHSTNGAGHTMSPLFAVGYSSKPEPDLQVHDNLNSSVLDIGELVLLRRALVDGITKWGRSSGRREDHNCSTRKGRLQCSCPPIQGLLKSSAPASNCI